MAGLVQRQREGDQRTPGMGDNDGSVDAKQSEGVRQ
jgi:hypothetical protein